MLLSRYIHLHHGAIDSSLQSLVCAGCGIAEIDISPKIFRLILAEKGLHFLPSETPLSESDGMNVAIAFLLREINLSRNTIKSLNGIVQFKNVARLNLSANLITQIEDCEPFCSLYSLQSLDLAGNRVTCLPNYRAHMLRICSRFYSPESTRLRMLDQQLVSDGEKLKAAAVLEKETAKMREILPSLCCVELLEALWNKLVLHMEMMVPVAFRSWKALLDICGRHFFETHFSQSSQNNLTHLMRLRVSHVIARNSPSTRFGFDFSEAMLEPALLQQAFAEATREIHSRLRELISRISATIDQPCPEFTDVLKHWEDVVSTAANEKVLFLTSIVQGRLAHQCFQHWQVAFNRYLTRNRVLTITSKMQCTVLAGCFRKWKKLADEAHRIGRMAHLLTLRYCLERWKRQKKNSQHSRQLCSLASTASITKQKRFFDQWRRRADIERRVRHCVCRKALRLWIAATTERCAAQHFMLKKTVSRFFSSWRQRIIHRRQRDTQLLRMKLIVRNANRLLLAKQYFTWLHYKRVKNNRDVSVPMAAAAGSPFRIQSLEIGVQVDAKDEQSTIEDFESSPPLSSTNHGSAFQTLVDRIIHLERCLVERDMLLENAAAQIEALRNRCERSVLT